MPAASHTCHAALHDACPLVKHLNWPALSTALMTVQLIIIVNHRFNIVALS